MDQSVDWREISPSDRNSLDGTDDSDAQNSRFKPPAIPNAGALVQQKEKKKTFFKKVFPATWLI